MVQKKKKRVVYDCALNIARKMKRRRKRCNNKKTVQIGGALESGQGEGVVKRCKKTVDCHQARRRGTGGDRAGCHR